MSEDYPHTLLELEKRFNTDEACRAYLFALRWPKGWVCPRCGSQRAWAVRRWLWMCSDCRYETSVTAGTIFQDSHIPLTIWFRAIWQITSQKQGTNALGLQRVLGLGGYKTAWMMLHKLRRAMIRPGRDRLCGVVEVDETYWGSEEPEAIGRLIYDKAIIIVGAKENGKGIGRIRMRRIPDLTKLSLHNFIGQMVERNASDLFYRVGGTPRLKIDGKVIPVSERVLTIDDAVKATKELTNQKQYEGFQKNFDIEEEISIS